MEREGRRAREGEGEREREREKIASLDHHLTII